MQKFRLHDRLIFPDLNTVLTKGGAVRVEPKAMELLVELATHSGEVLSKDHILRTVWGGVFVCEEVVTNAISVLRRAFGEEARAARLIQTVPKRGYRLTVRPVREGVDAGNIRETGNLNRSILRVRYLRQQETVSSLRSACAYCKEIIRQEPNCAAAYAELALALFLLEKLGAMSRECVEPMVRHAVDRALCLDERASLSLVCRAKQEYRYDWNWDAAERHFRAALEADPDDADAFTEVTIMFLIMRRFDDALVHVRRACQLDPLSPAACLQLAHTSYAMGKWQTAARHYRRLLQYSPEHVFAYWGLAETLTRSGNPPEAIAALTQGLAIPGNAHNPFLLASLSRSKAAGGSGVRLRTAFEEFPCEISDLVLSAELCGSLGQPAKAFALLDEAAEMRHYRLGAINIFPQCGPLWEDPRYHRFLRRIGLA